MSGDSAAKRIAGYEVERELGQGGMGTVHLALQPILDRPAVLKVLRRDLAGDAQQEERFQREAQTAARIHHPNVVAVYDCFAWRGELYLAQEYVDGLDLASLLARCGPLPARIASLIALEVSRGLEEIHAQGIVHRDLKPANVLVSRRGEVKIADFGIALPDHAPALTRVGCAVGTAPYMAPEQLLGDRVDERSDSFAFGLLLYELLTGCKPFAGEDDSEAALLRSIQRGHYVSPRRRARRTPRWLARSIHLCLRARPQSRPSLQQLRRRLERRVPTPEAELCRSQIAAWLQQSQALEGDPAGADPAATRIKPAAAPQRPRRPWLKAAAAALLIGAVLLGGMLWVRARPSQPSFAPGKLPPPSRIGRPDAPAASPAPAESRPERSSPRKVQKPALPRAGAPAARGAAAKAAKPPVAKSAPNKQRKKAATPRTTHPRR